MGRSSARNFLKIIQVGNSNGIIIPKKMLDQIGVTKNKFVMVTIEQLTKSELNDKLKELQKEVF